ncbi:MAG TPA: hypothetical protein VET23_11310, partial [Chitinophagaceae bacterium]|nr:hypothetical protein [Chitinophagaceae bacterium]
KEWRRWRDNLSPLKDKREATATSLCFYMYSIGAGHLGISTFNAITNEQVEILKRFKNVFVLSYQRYTDVAQAEAQAREAQIELALERVRARTMAMQKSEELKETTLVLFQQFKALGATTAQVSICIFDEGTTKGEMFVTLKGEKIDRSFPMDLDAESFVMKRAKKAFLNDQKTFSITITGKELQNYNHWRNILIGKKGWDESVAVRKQSWYVNAVFFSRGMMGISSDSPPSDEALKLLERFGNVFDLTFTRFLDLQNAEAQAREAQIETALERVRSKTMAMQKSEELDSVIKTVYSELKHLDVSFYRCFIMIFDEQKGATWWMGSPDDDLFHEGFYVQYHTHPPHLAYLKGWEQRRQKWEYRLAGQIKKDWDEFIFSQTALSKLPPIVIQDMKSYEFAHLSASFENFGCITTGGLEGLSEKSFDILNRFAKVFDQSYTRFNDLKNAEAQARESQIQLAMERVRARTMAMQKSDELAEAASLLFTQIADLGTNSWSSGFIIFQPDELSINSWMSKPDGSMGVPFNIPVTEDPFFIRIY